VLGIILLSIFTALSLGCQSTSTQEVGGGGGGDLLRDEFDDTPSTVGVDVPDDVAFPEPDPDSWPERAESVWVPQTGAFVFRDLGTGSWWNLRGEAYSGPLTNTRLQQYPSFNSFWFAWSVFYHGSELWGLETTNLPGEIEGDGNCEVPCSEIRLGCGGGRDCIPALDWDGENGRPVAEMVGVDNSGADYLRDTDFVLGVVIDGEARAYPHNVLWWHEIYNDTFGDRTLSVTFCPLTGSGIVFEGQHDGREIDFEVSGNLYNSNLVMVDRASETLWSQMLLTGISGPRAGERLETLPVTETTWRQWRQMYPQTLVASDSQGYSRDYERYPYGDYRANNNDTFSATNPDFEDHYDAKDRVMGVTVDETSRAYAFPELESVGDRVIVNDELRGTSLVVVFEAENRFAVPFERTVEGKELTFIGATAE
jgi:hypothetical protein